MFRFAKPDGSSFNLNYTGPIFAFDSGNDRIALCPGNWRIALSNENSSALKIDDPALITWKGTTEEEGDVFEGVGNPSQWDDWEVVMKIDEDQECIMQRALANAWVAFELCESLIFHYSNQT